MRPLDLFAASVTPLAISGCGGPSKADDTEPAPESPASLTIDAPANGAAFAEGTAIEFSATARDAAGEPMNADIEWSSDLDGSLGAGGAITVTPSDGLHDVAARAVAGDSAVEDSISLLVGTTAEATLGEEGGEIALANGTTVARNYAAANVLNTGATAIDASGRYVVWVTSDSTVDSTLSLHEVVPEP